ncbi:ROK family protein [Streptomyces netropsis]|uniref:ROK family protein n=1 Tax=Streptomyces netropsis TaxID=55404 RepID=UPI0016192D22|nr:transcriptional regulator [Streptomyces netropsis]
MGGVNNGVQDGASSEGATGGSFAFGANLAALRDHNAALVLGLLRDAGAAGASRAELAGRTGLTPQAVSKISARLRAAGLAAEAGRRASTGGKPATTWRLVPDAAHAIGLHLDRDALTAILVDLTGTTVASRTAPLAFGAGAEALLGTVAAEVSALLAEADGGAVGAGPAAVSPGHGGGVLAGDGPSPSGAVDPRGGPPGSGAPPADTREGSPTAVRPAPRASRATGTASRATGTASRADGTVPPATGTVPRVSGSLLGVGVAVPGPLDHASGVLHRVTGFPEWDGFPLRDALAERLGLPVVVDKDTNAAALGLVLRGAGGGVPAADSFAYLHLGTGLGAGLVLGGGVHRGARTGAGEFGHQVLQLDGPPCPCGNRGCIEALCLGAVAAGDTARAARLLGVGAANLVRLLDIDLVLLGGRTVLAEPEPYLRGVRAVLAEDAARADGRTVPVAVAPGGGRTVVEGAAELALAPLFGRSGTAFAPRSDETKIVTSGGM